MLKGFRDFMIRGNVIDLAVAVIVGAAFTGIVNSLVKDIINPLIAATVGQPDFSYLIWNLNGGKIAYGNFLNALISFLLMATVVYFAIVLPFGSLLTRLRLANPVPKIKICPECFSEIPAEAKRCAHCAQLVA